VKGQVITADRELSRGLLRCGSMGSHLLFDSLCIHRAFERIERGAIRQADLLSAHIALRELASEPDLHAKRAFVRELPRATSDLLVFLYFRRLDRYLGESERVYH
jgi:hypothetical protein